MKHHQGPDGQIDSVTSDRPPTSGKAFTMADVKNMRADEGGRGWLADHPAKEPETVDMVNHPPHYRRGPEITCPNCEHRFTIQCIQVIRHIRDMRLATAVKYIWRVAFGGKANDHEDIDKSRWYVQDWLDNPIG